MENNNRKAVAELNRFNTSGEAIRLATNGEIFLTKPYDSEKKIGRLYESDNKTIYIKEENERDLIRKHNGWSINSIVLSVSSEVQYKTDQAVYCISQKDAYAHGIPFKNHSDGLDNKIVVPLPYWTKTYIDKSKMKAISLFGQSWGLRLYPIISDQKFIELSKKIKKDRNSPNNGFGVAPLSQNVFNAFHATPFESLKVVLLGDEPQAHHDASPLAYSGTDMAKKVMDVIEEEVYDGFMLDKDTDLTRWAEQGVLLINRTLTVSVGNPGSHKDYGWDYFTKVVVDTIINNNPEILFFTWEKSVSKFLDDFLGHYSNKPTHFKNPIAYPSVFKEVNGFLCSRGIERVFW